MPERIILLVLVVVLVLEIPCKIEDEDENDDEDEPKPRVFAQALKPALLSHFSHFSTAWLRLGAPP